MSIFTISVVAQWKNDKVTQYRAMESDEESEEEEMSM